MTKLVCTGLGATLLLFSTYIPTALAQLYVLGGDAEATPSSTPSADVLALISTAQLCSCTAHFYDGWAPGHCSGDPSCDPAPTTTLTTTNDFTSTPTYSPVAGGTSSICLPATRRGRAREQTQSREWEWGSGSPNFSLCEVNRCDA